VTWPGLAWPGLACEEKRFDLAAREFGVASRREARLLVIAEQRAELDARLAAAHRLLSFRMPGHPDLSRRQRVSR
jgi:hypothetical protein